MHEKKTCSQEFCITNFWLLDGLGKQQTCNGGRGIENVYTYIHPLHATGIPYTRVSIYRVLMKQ